MKDPDFIPDEVFQPETWPYQANWDEWGRGYQGGPPGVAPTGANPRGTSPTPRQGHPVASRDNAVASLSQIAEQGERHLGDGRPLQAVALRPVPADLPRDEEAGAGLPRDGWSPARNVASNPYIPEGDGGRVHRRTTPRAVRTAARRDHRPGSPKLSAHLFNIRYRMLLTVPVAQASSFGRGARARAGRDARGRRSSTRPSARCTTCGPSPAVWRRRRARRQHPRPPGRSRRPTVPDAVHTAGAGRWARSTAGAAQATAAGGRARFITELLRMSPPPRHLYLHSLREAERARMLGVIDRILSG